MRGRRVLGSLLLGAVGLAACSTEEPAPIPDWDFFGVIGDVAFNEPLVEGDGLYRGGPDSGYRSGALTITLADGELIEVPSGIPGGNWCRDLAARGARNEECVVAGAFDAAGEVAWFRVFDVMNTSEKRGGGRHVEVFGIERLVGEVLTINGLPFIVRSVVTVECLGDISTLTEAVESGVGLMADVSLPDVAVYNVWCITTD